MKINRTFYHVNLLIIPGIAMSLFCLYFVIPAVQPMALMLPVLLFLIVPTDVYRIHKHFKTRGAFLSSVKWTPFGPKPPSLSTQNRNSNFYQVEISAPGKKTSKASIRINLLNGVELLALKVMPTQKPKKI